MRFAVRSALFHCLSDPGEGDRDGSSEYFADGILVVENGRIAALGPTASLADQLGDTPIENLSGKLVIPGLIDCHVHFPQLDIIASYGERLLDWLNRYAYPAEMRYADADYARTAAGFFLDELLANGTTTAVVFATVHAHSAEVLFEAAARRGMRLIAGKVLMDRNCPQALRDDPESGYADSRRLIESWHGRDRLGYAITPRFALTSSEEQLDAAGRLAREYPDVWIHTHLAENDDEIRAVHRQFPWCDSYLEVYEQFGLLRERSIFAHCLHLEDGDRERMSARGGAAAFCPTSNLFLGSGLFDLRSMHDAGVRVGLGSDVGGGTSLSMLRTMSTAYQALHLQHQNLPASRALYLATLGAAKALGLEGHVGSLAPGTEADFVVLDPAATRLSARRQHGVDDIAERLFALMILGDDRHIAQTWVGGQRVAG